MTHLIAETGVRGTANESLWVCFTNIRVISCKVVRIVEQTFVTASSRLSQCMSQQCFGQFGGLQDGLTDTVFLSSDWINQTERNRRRHQQCRICLAQKIIFHVARRWHEGWAQTTQTNADKQWIPGYHGYFAVSYHLRQVVYIQTKKVKVAHTRLLSVGSRSWSRFLAVSLQVRWVLNPAVGCHYFPPGLQLPPQPLRGLLPIFRLGEQRHNVCEQFA